MPFFKNSIKLYRVSLDFDSFIFSGVKLTYYNVNKIFQIGTIGQYSPIFDEGEITVNGKRYINKS